MLPSKSGSFRAEPLPLGASITRPVLTFKRSSSAQIGKPERPLQGEPTSVRDGQRPDPPWTGAPPQVIHCVMYPRREFDLPIVSMDMVGTAAGRVSLAVVDACPVALNRSLPPQYVTIMQ